MYTNILCIVIVIVSVYLIILSICKSKVCTCMLSILHDILDTSVPCASKEIFLVFADFLINLPK